MGAFGLGVQLLGDEMVAPSQVAVRSATEPPSPMPGQTLGAPDSQVIDGVYSDTRGSEVG